jgi:hypothetical protein
VTHEGEISPDFGTLFELESRWLGRTVEALKAMAQVPEKPGKKKNAFLVPSRPSELQKVQSQPVESAAALVTNQCESSRARGWTMPGATSEPICSCEAAGRLQLPRQSAVAQQRLRKLAVVSASGRERGDFAHQHRSTLVTTIQE